MPFLNRFPLLAQTGQNILMAFESLRNRRFRTFLTILGVFIGVVIIISVASGVNGFRMQVIDNFEQFGTTTIFVTRMPFIGGPRRQDVRTRRHLTRDDALALRDQAPAIRAVTPMMALPGWAATVRYENREMIGPELRGAYPAMSDAMNISLTQGRFFTEQENLRRDAVCIIGFRITETLFPDVSPIGKRVRIGGKTFRVIGTMDKFKESPFDPENPQDSMLVIPFYTFRSLYPYERELFIIARAHTGQLPEAVRQTEEILRARRHVPWNDDNDFEIGTSESIIEMFNNITFAALATMFALSTVAFMVGGVGVMNIMLASVKERTREIGIRRAIGARRRDIVVQFLTEAMVLTGLGGLLGVAIGEMLVPIISHLLPTLSFSTPMWARVFGFVGSVMVGIVFGLWPAISAARLDPIKALHYE